MARALPSTNTTWCRQLCGARMRSKENKQQQQSAQRMTKENKTKYENQLNAFENGCWFMNWKLIIQRRQIFSQITLVRFTICVHWKHETRPNNFICRIGCANTLATRVHDSRLTNTKQIDGQRIRGHFVCCVFTVQRQLLFIAMKK